MRALLIWLLLLPLFSHAALAQSLGGRASYLGGGVEDARRGAALTLDLSQGVPWRAFTLVDPPRLVLDFREVDWASADAAQMNRSQDVAELRMGPFSAGWSRLVVVLSAPALIREAGMTIDEGSGQATLSVLLKDASAAEMDAASGAPRDPRWDRPQALLTAPPRPEGAPLRIVLDPGHGGIDPGAERGGVREATLMLTFGRQLRDVLRRAGYEVVLTRDEDVFVSLEGRVAAAHDARADLFISLHADAIEEGIAHGASVYMLDEMASDAASEALAERHDRDDILAGLDLSGADDRIADVLLDIARLDNGPRSLSLAQHLLGGIENAVGEVHKRPLRRAGFSVLKAADIPSVLIELGFLSTERDRANLLDPDWRNGMAAGIRDGIAAWSLEDAALSRLRRQ